MGGWPAVFASVILAILLTLSHVLLKFASMSGGGSGFDVMIRGYGKVLLALMIYLFVFFLYSYLLRAFPLSILYPVYTGLSLIFVVVSGLAVFGERMMLAQYLGILLILAGVVLVSWGAEAGK